MAQADYIPAGRTSRIVRGSSEIQIQTEYAYRPSPRLTTTIFARGQVMHKVEQELEGTIASFEDKVRIEDRLRKQHFEILKTLRDESGAAAFMDSTKPVHRDNSTQQRICEISGVERVIYIDNEGKFSSDQVSKEFTKKYSTISKSLHELINIFGMLPGGHREKGVYEIERNRLYLASCGKECYFILTGSPAEDINFESEIRRAILR